MGQEMTGSTRIISILPQGTSVHEGDVVCEFDASAYRQEVQSQKIRYLQAKAWVDQAQSLLEVSEISLREYRDGICPQDAQLIHQYVRTCEMERERATRNHQWGKDTFAKGYYSSVQLKADALTLQQAEMALHEARGMLVRLEKFTAPKLIKALEAKVEAIRADRFTQEAAFELEKQRLERLEKVVENCSLRAPRDGIVVYVNPTDRRGQADTQIQEGLTVREGQAIFSIPDPRVMQVRARINESKVALIHKGQPVLVRVDAFPDRPLRGTVGDITAIPAPVTRSSDVKIYFAVIKIEDGFVGLRPGLSAEVDFYVDTHNQVTRVPLQAVRKVGGKTFVAVKPAAADARPPWTWVPVALGQSNATHAEVLSGLRPGDRVIAEPERLPAPQSNLTVQTAYHHDG
jgi:multidrug efflux pump subunit AcrA (membrane-fusion protein)